MSEYRIVYRSSQGMLCVINYDIQKKVDGEWVTEKNVYNMEAARDYVAEQGGIVVDEPGRRNQY